MPRVVVMYLEIPEWDGEVHPNPYESCCGSLDDLVDNGHLDGYFTLTADGEVWADREDLVKLAQAAAAAQKKGGA